MRRILVTLALLAGYHFAHRFSAAALSAEAVVAKGVPSVAALFMGLGIAPWTTAFVAVEFLSFVLPWGRRQRRGGVEGRRKLNRLAVWLSLALATVMASTMVTYFEGMATTGGVPLVSNPGWFFRGLACLTLVAGTTMVFLLAGAISRWGLGNGYCLVFMYGLAVPLLNRRDLFGADGTAYSSHSIELMALGAAVAALSWRFARRETVVLQGAGEEEVRFSLPAFPQGVAAMQWSLTLLGLLNYLWGSGDLEGYSNPALAVVGAAILVVVLSLLTYQLFSSRKRLEWNLPEGLELARGEIAGKRSLVVSTCLLLIFGVGFFAGEKLWDFQLTYLLSFPLLMLSVATLFDLVQEWRFRRRHRDRVVRLLELDNVHLASYLRGTLRAQEVDALVRTHNFRALFFFLFPLVKMELLVPAQEAQRAVEIVRPNEIRTV